MRLLVIAFLLSVVSCAATVQGYIRDEEGHPLPHTSVSIRSLDGSVLQSLETDQTGFYRAVSLAEGTYRISTTDGKAEKRFSLFGGNTERVDLVIKPSMDSIPFSDDTNFTVAGVTDNTYMGSHGSDVTQRSLENLSKATSSLQQGGTGQSVDALQAALRNDPQNPALHHALANAEEVAGKPLDAAREYQRAAEINSTEDNLFDWGVELLNHGAGEPATLVFQKGERLYPNSARMLIGEAVSKYSQGDYANAASIFFRATDVNPSDALPYMVLAGTQIPAITRLSGYSDRMTRFARLRPDDAWANYYYALVLLEQGQPDAESLLNRAVQIDPNLAEAYLHLGILCAERGDWTRAIDKYKKAISTDPRLEQAHYRLAAAYRKTGATEAAEHESEVFRQLSTAATRERDKERSQMERFVIKMRTTPPDH